MVDIVPTPAQQQMRNDTTTIQLLTDQLSKMTTLNHAIRLESERRRLALHAVADCLEGIPKDKTMVGKKQSDALVSIAKNARESADPSPDPVE